MLTEQQLIYDLLPIKDLLKCDSMTDALCEMANAARFLNLAAARNALARLLWDGSGG
jgi:hypothetical protein